MRRMYRNGGVETGEREEVGAQSIIDIDFPTPVGRSALRAGHPACVARGSVNTANRLLIDFNSGSFPLLLRVGSISLSMHPVLVEVSVL